ncbi:MAG: hypothetical protein H7235_05570 [Bdellovibrionaceae bacterium]|nr:hypothetical protein [Pseudobdellovibrionaceae bacterium]
MNQDINDAIKNKNLIRFDYDNISRTVEPYCYGTTPTGNEALRGFQTSGEKFKMAWKLFDLTKASNIVALDESFKPRKDYKQGDKVITQVLNQI